MPRYRAGALKKGSRKKGEYVVIDAASRAQAMLDVRVFFPGVPITRIFAFDAEPTDKPSTIKHPFTIDTNNKGAQ